MRVAWEVAFYILDSCVENALVQDPQSLHDKPLCILNLLQTCKAFHRYLELSPSFRQLRLWSLIARLGWRSETKNIVVGWPGDLGTVLHLDLQPERVDARGNCEVFLVMTHLRTRRRRQQQQVQQQQRRQRRRSWHRSANGHITDETVSTALSDNVELPYESPEHFMDDICALAVRNRMSLWLWKHGPDGFLSDSVLKHYHFRVMADVPGKIWLAWDRPTPDQRRFTDDVLFYNVEWFGKL